MGARKLKRIEAHALVVHSEGCLGGKLKRREQSEGTSQTDVAILPTPVLDDHARLGECIKQRAAEALIERLAENRLSNSNRLKRKNKENGSLQFS